MITKETIIKEIIRTAKANSGKPLGKSKFEKQTGISANDWYGKYWARWGDAIKEAGLTPNEMQGAYDKPFLIEKIILLIRELNRFPTVGEIRLKAHQDKSFPGHSTFDSHFDSKSQFIQTVLEYGRKKL